MDALHDREPTCGDIRVVYRHGENGLVSTTHAKARSARASRSGHIRQTHDAAQIHAKVECVPPLDGIAGRNLGWTHVSQ